VAYDLYDGISDQTFCNSHPWESESLLYWLNIYLYTPYDYEFTSVWRLWYLLHATSNDLRREVFEEAYQFTEGQRVNPITGQLQDVTIIGAPNYFDFLAEFQGAGTKVCSDYLYPFW